LAQGLSAVPRHFPGFAGTRHSLRETEMSRLLALAACAAFVDVARGGCPWPNNLQGQNDFQPVARDYHGNKTLAAGDDTALCTLATNQLTQAEGCDYDWIYAWLQTVQTDKVNYCGAASSGSFRSSLSGSDTSIPSSDSSFYSGDSSVSSVSWKLLTWQQKLFWWVIFICIFCCLCAVAGVLIANTSKKGKKKQQQQYDQYDDQDYEAQQYDQNYGGEQYTEPPAEAMYDARTADAGMAPAAAEVVADAAAIEIPPLQPVVAAAPVQYVAAAPVQYAAPTYSYGSYSAAQPLMG